MMLFGNVGAGNSVGAPEANLTNILDVEAPQCFIEVWCVDIFGFDIVKK